MVKTSTVVLALVLLAVVTLCSGQGISILGNRLTLHDSKLTCSPYMACRMAVCVWQRIPRITDDHCTFFDSHCTCPENNICAMTGTVTSRNNLITFQYRCRDPSELFQDFAGNNNNNPQPQ